MIIYHASQYVRGYAVKVLTAGVWVSELRASKETWLHPKHLCNVSELLFTLAKGTMLRVFAGFSFLLRCFPHLQGAVGAWGARRLRRRVTTAGWVVAAVLFSSIWIVHQEGQLSDMALQRQRVKNTLWRYNITFTGKKKAFTIISQELQTA